MQDTINSIKTEIQTILKNKFDYDLVNDSLINFEIPKDKNNGDYASNIAMRLAKELHNSPINIANIIKEELLKSSLPIKDIQIAGPGFINFFIDESSIASCINTILKEQDNYGHNNSGAGKKVLVEYVSANPTGVLHVGHAKAAAWGDSMTRIMKTSSYDCLREYYINDAGAQIDHLADSLFIRYQQANGMSVELPEDGYHGKDIIEIANKVFNEDKDKWIKEDKEVSHKFFKKLGLNIELDRIKRTLKGFGVEFDVWSSEQTIRDSNKVEWVMDELNKKGLLYEEDNAIWFKSTNFGDDKDRVLKKSDGLYTYLTPDIAYHLNKLERGYDHLIDLLGADHHGYIARMKAALMAFGYSKDCLEIDIVQMIRLIENGEEVKMSKRTGKSVTLEDLMEDIGVDATRYFLCQRACDAHLDFDLTLAKSSSNDNPVYYAQYAHARICSILSKVDSINQLDKYDLLTNEKEIDLLKHLNEFPNEVGMAAASRSPNKICNYIQKLAALFHSYYGAVKIIDESNNNLTNERLNLLLATKITLKNALNLIGVSAPTKM